LLSKKTSELLLKDRQLDLRHRDADRRLDLGIPSGGRDAEGSCRLDRFRQPGRGRVAARAGELVRPRLEIVLSLAGLALSNSHWGTRRMAKSAADQNCNRGVKSARLEAYLAVLVGIRKGWLRPMRTKQRTPRRCARRRPGRRGRCVPGRADGGRLEAGGR
jgi:hypothetical protein